MKSGTSALHLPIIKPIDAARLYDKRWQGSKDGDTPSRDSELRLAEFWKVSAAPGFSTASLLPLVTNKTLGKLSCVVVFDCGRLIGHLDDLQRPQGQVFDSLSIL